MSWIKKTIVPFYFITSSIALLLLIDFLVGGFLIPCYEREHLGVSKCINTLRVPHHVYHHDLSKNGRGIERWGGEKPYTLCTDNNGFKISCNAIDKNLKNFDIAFIGDSFTEGIGLSYEDTFVGQISKSRPELKIANLGVSSYSPSIYFSKVNFLLEQGITFKELIVYIDISDIQDEAISYKLSDAVVVSRGLEVTKHSSIKKLAHWSFPLTYYGLHRLKILFFPSQIESVSVTYLDQNYPRSAWTYNPYSAGYGLSGVKGGIEESLKSMTKLSELLKDKGIKLSIGVYPWPGQLLYDKVHSEQVRIWDDFCSTKCVRFYNSFESFFALKDKISADKTIELYFILGDVHHNRQGAEIIAKDFLNAY
jgi:hypothetical protein